MRTTLVLIAVAIVGALSVHLWLDLPLGPERLEARISRDQKELFQRAELQGRTLTDFVVNSLEQAAVRTIEESELIRLSADDSRMFAETLLSPPAPNRKLRTAARRYMKMIEG